MDTFIAAILAMSFNFITLIALAGLFVIPWTRRVALRDALLPLVTIHTARTIALQLFSAQASGSAISDAARDQIVWGDQVGFALALVTVVLLGIRHRAAIATAWVLVIATVIDLFNAFRLGLSEGLLGGATDVSWTILTFYVPVLWVSIALVGWLLVTRRSESLAASS